MRQCCYNPTLLEYAALNRCDYFDATPMARPSKKNIFACQTWKNHIMGHKNTQYMVYWDLQWTNTAVT